MSDSVFEDLCDRFEASWRSGQALRVESLLPEVDSPRRDQLLRTLLEIELEYRFASEKLPSLEEYQARFTQHGSLVEQAFTAALRRVQLSSSSGLAETCVALAQDAGTAPDKDLSQIGPYKILHPIGEGGMGQVFIAEQTAPVKRRVALKVIKTDAPTKEILARFEAERQALAMMDHHNIAKVFDAGVTDNGRPFFAMELVNGIPITEYCDKNQLSPDDRLKLFVQTCRAIQHAHTKGIVHRDIKPSNVLVALDDGTPSVKVIDFGLAKALRETRLTDRTLFTQHGQIVGTLAYMSPEQAEVNTLDIDTRTDVYSLGVVFYELLTGSTPITAEEIRSVAFDRILALIREFEPPRPSVRLAGSGDAMTGISAQRKTEPWRLNLILKGDLDWIAVKALEKDRNRRYDTAAAFADDVQRYLNSEAIQARPPSLGYQLQKSFRRYRSRYIAAGAILGLLIAGLLGTGTMWYWAAAAEKRAHLETAKAEEALRKEALERRRANSEAAKALKNEKRANDTAAAAKFQLANARWDAGQARQARRILNGIPEEYRNNFEWNYCNRRFQGSEVTLYGHTKPVRSACYSPDGDRIASCTAATLKIWDAITGKEIRSRRRHQCHSICFSPDGNRVASVTTTGQACIWDLRTNKEVTFEIWGNWPHGGQPSIQFSSDGQTLASGNAHDDGITMWDAASGRKLKSLPVERTDAGGLHPSHSIGFSPSGSHVALASQDGLKMWTTSTEGGMEPIWKTDVAYEVNDLSFSLDGKIVAQTTLGGVVLRDVETGTPLRAIQAAILNGFSISPDGARIATGGRDELVKIWDVRSGVLSKSLAGHVGPVHGVMFSPSGTRIVSWADDCTLKIWNCTDIDESSIVVEDREVNIGARLCFSDDGQKLAFLTGGASARELTVSSYELSHLSLSVSGWFPTPALRYTPDGTCLAAVHKNRDRKIELWNVSSGELIRAIDGPFHGPCAFHPDASLIAVGDEELIKLTEVKSGSEVLAFHQPDSGPIHTFRFGPSGKMLAAHTDRSIWIWNLSSEGNATLSKIGSGERVAWRSTCTRFSPSGAHILVETSDNTLSIWDARTGESIHTLAGHKGGLTSACFDDSGTRIAAADRDGQIKLWSTVTGAELLTLRGHRGAVRDVAFRPHNSTQLASIGDDGTLRIWDATPVLETILSGTHDPEGKWLAVPQGNETLMVDLDFKNNSQEQVRRSHLARARPLWHERRSREAFAAEEWFAAAFHSASLCKLQPDSKKARERLLRSYQKLEMMDVFLPPVIVQALALPAP